MDDLLVGVVISPSFKDIESLQRNAKLVTLDGGITNYVRQSER